MYQTLNLNPHINPAFAARVSHERQPVLAKLPLAPINGSPVPHLTSLYHDDQAGDFGSRGYPGNCGGNLIKDLLCFFTPSLVLDPMSGSGTCRDVCEHLRIPCIAWDIHQGIDACDPLGFGESETFDFIWSHPPYWRQKLYASDARDLSRSPTLDHFLRRYGQFIRNAAKALKPGGILAVLMGDYADRHEGYIRMALSAASAGVASADRGPVWCGRLCFSLGTGKLGWRDGAFWAYIASALLGLTWSSIRSQGGLFYAQVSGSCVVWRQQFSVGGECLSRAAGVALFGTDFRRAN